MQNEIKVNDLQECNFTNQLFRHWANRKMVYTESVHYLAKSTQSYWLIDLIGYLILPKLLKKHPDWFYVIQLSVKDNGSAKLIVEDGNDNIHLKHKIKWTDFPLKGKAVVKFYLCEGEEQYCLMLPSEY